MLRLHGERIGRCKVCSSDLLLCNLIVYRTKKERGELQRVQGKLKLHSGKIGGSEVVIPLICRMLFQISKNQIANGIGLAL